MIWLFIFLLAGVIITNLLVFAWGLSGYLEPKIGKLKESISYNPPASPTRFILHVGLKERSQIDLKRVPGYLIGLLLLHEDDLFFIHRGFNFPEIRVRFFDFIRHGGTLRGGSSISQQFVKSAVYANARRETGLRFIYKIRDAAAVLRLEAMYSKEEILQLYLQSVRLGRHHLYGFDEVVRILFNKELYEIELHEALFLCGLIPSPTGTFRKMYQMREYYAYPWGTAFTKTVDLLRMYLITWGREAIYDPSSIRYEDIVKRFTALDQYSPHGLSPTVELDLEVRAHEILLKARGCFKTILDKKKELDEFQRARYSVSSGETSAT